MNFLVTLVVLFVSTSCVKDEGAVSNANITNNNNNNTPSTTSSGTDPLASYAWHLENTGQTSFSSGAGVAGEDISVKDVHEAGIKGKGVRIAISDTGVDVDHDDLKANGLSGEHRNYAISDSSLWRNNNPYPTDGEAHGTAVAGLSSAVGWNNIGSRGIAPDSSFAAFRFVTSYSTSNTQQSLLARWYDQMDGDFDIFNYSYGSGPCTFETEDELEASILKDGVTNLRSGKGAVYVQAAGNGFSTAAFGCTGGVTVFDNTNRDPSHSTPYKIQVGAINATGVKSSYSTPGAGLWVSAPGGEYGTTSPAMITTDLLNCSVGYSYLISASTSFNGGNHALNKGCNYFSTMNGTSSASPMVSGVVALMLEANPALTWRDVKHILATTSDIVHYNPATNTLTHPGGGAYTLAGYTYDRRWVQNDAGFYFSNWYGFGRVNAAAAVTEAQTYSTDLGTYLSTINPITEETYYDSGVVNSPIPDNDSTGVASNIPVRHNYFVESVQVRLTTNHTRPRDLAVHLVSPSGTESVLLNINSNFTNATLDDDFLMISNAFYGEESYGNWSLRLYDGKGTQLGDLVQWSITINGHVKAATALTPNRPGIPTMVSSYGSGRNSPPFTFTASTTFTVIRYEASVGTSPEATDVSAWTSLGAGLSGQLRNMSLTNGSTYYLNLRAIDISEKPSLIRSAAWTASY